VVSPKAVGYAVCIHLSVLDIPTPNSQRGVGTIAKLVANCSRWSFHLVKVNTVDTVVFASCLSRGLCLFVLFDPVVGVRPASPSASICLLFSDLGVGVGVDPASPSASVCLLFVRCRCRCRCRSCLSLGLCLFIICPMSMSMSVSILPLPRPLFVYCLSNLVVGVHPASPSASVCSSLFDLVVGNVEGAEQ